MADVDVVIVNWNSGKQLAECVRSVQELESSPTYRLSKCIVVDNASADGSAETLPSGGLDLQVLRSPVNQGFGAACNRGAALVQSDYILLLNPDIRLNPDSLSGAMMFLEHPENARVGLLGEQLVDEQCRAQPSAARFPTPGSLIYQMIGLDRAWPRRFPPFAVSDCDPELSGAVEVLQGAFLLVRRAAFHQLSGFDERFFMYYEDVDLAYRARQAGWTAWYFAGGRAFHQGGGTTETIKAERLAYWMTSRARYVARHFGGAAALGVVIASLTLELGARLIWNAATFSGRHLLDTLAAYRAYLRGLPTLLRT